MTNYYETMIKIRNNHSVTDSIKNTRSIFKHCVCGGKFFYDEIHSEFFCISCWKVVATDKIEFESKPKSGLKCFACFSPRIVHNGNRYLKLRGMLPRYICMDCTKSFTPTKNHFIHHRYYPFESYTYGMKLIFAGMSLRETVKFVLKKFSSSPSHETFMRIKNNEKLLVNIKPKEIERVKIFVDAHMDVHNKTYRKKAYLNGIGRNENRYVKQHREI